MSSTDQTTVNVDQSEQFKNGGWAPVKKEFIEFNKRRNQLNLNYVLKSDREKLEVLNNNDTKTTDDINKSDEKRELDENDDCGNKKKRLKKLHGQNKNRNALMNENNIRDSQRNGAKLCSKFAGSVGLEEYSDIIEQCPRTAEECRFGHDLDAFMKTNPVYLDNKCYMFDQYGFCGFGPRCKFAKSHIDPNGKNLIDKDKFMTNGPKLEKSYKNILSGDLKTTLRKKKYDFSVLQERLGPASIDEREWKKIDFKNKLYLAPLTTVGNLPFRRICKEFGADITCGEMAMADNILNGQPSEWALLRRHSSEDLFGVQLCGSNPQILAKATKLINDQCEVDFIDLNIGCPIDCVFNKGAGSALMGRYNKLSQIITSMSRASEVPLTIKMRAGISNDKFTADKLINSLTTQFPDGRIAMLAVHGRSKEARYTKPANWDYIRKCASQSVDGKIPIFGTGDILSYKDYEDIMNYEDNKISGCMIARGALIKPWIFTEIKERRDWDISSNERLDILKKFVNYGLEQFGCDGEGVEKTRKFLLEWCSFLCRYIPVGLLDVLPQKINEVPPIYHGRDDLETLFASHCCEDWIKISEMLLGPVKENFLFLPKHKSNAYQLNNNI